MKKLFFFAMTAAVLMGCKSNEPGEGERVIDMLPLPCHQSNARGTEE